MWRRSIRRNICYGLEAEDGVPADQQPSAEDVEQAARLANAHEFISAMPDGYDSVSPASAEQARLLHECTSEMQGPNGGHAFNAPTFSMVTTAFHSHLNIQHSA